MRRACFALIALLSAARTANAASPSADSPASEATPDPARQDTDAPPSQGPPATGSVPFEQAERAGPNAPDEAARGNAPGERRASRTIDVSPKGQENKCEPCEDHEAAEGAGTLIVGPGLFDLSSLNDRLQANGYEKLSSLMTLLGGEGRAVFRGGFVAGARGAAILAPSRNGPGGVETRFGGGFGMLDFGYAFVHTAPFLLTVTGGIGGYGVSLDIGDEQPAAFDDVLKNPHKSASLSRGGLLVGLALGMDARVHMGPVERGRRGFFTIGVRVGGLYGPPIGDWNLAPATKATEAPSLGLNGGYAVLAVGFGGGRTERQ